jgi:hypothetical protein
MSYGLPKGVLIGILFLNIGRLTGLNYKKNYPTGKNYKKKLAYSNISSLIRRSNHLYFGKAFAVPKCVRPMLLAKRLVDRKSIFDHCEAYRIEL